MLGSMNFKQKHKTKSNSIKFVRLDKSVMSQICVNVKSSFLRDFKFDSGFSCRTDVYDRSKYTRFRNVISNIFYYTFGRFITIKIITISTLCDCRKRLNTNCKSHIVLNIAIVDTGHAITSLVTNWTVIWKPAMLIALSVVKTGLFSAVTAVLGLTFKALFTVKMAALNLFASPLLSNPFTFALAVIVIADLAYRGAKAMREFIFASSPPRFAQGGFVDHNKPFGIYDCALYETMRTIEPTFQRRRAAAINNDQIVEGVVRGVRHIRYFRRFGDMVYAAAAA